MSLSPRPGVMPMAAIMGTECNARETIELKSPEDELREALRHRWRVNVVVVEPKPQSRDCPAV
jgi:hypothetical protein